MRCASIVPVSPRHSEDGTFYWIGYRLVGLTHRRLPCAKQKFGIKLLLVLDAFGKASQQLGQNDAGIAARPH